MKRVEDLHWWFVGRRAIVRDVLAGLRGSIPSSEFRILDAGCGTGGNFRMLSGFGHVTGLEHEPIAAGLARGQGSWNVVAGSLPENVPFRDERFHVVVMTDVLEHIDDDVGALKSVSALLAPGGHLLLTVPAFQFLWSRHDEQHHHKRRYSADSFRKVIADADLEVVKLSYFNFWLFPLVAAARFLSRKRTDAAPESLLRVPPRLINGALAALFGGESLLLRRMRLPFGVSLLAVLRPRSS
jgi:SAM-dependent methyltransferase